MSYLFMFSKVSATPEVYTNLHTLSRHAALPIYAMLKFWMSANDCVEKMTLTFLLRSGLSHWRMRAANIGSSRNSQDSSRISRVGAPSKRSSKRANRYPRTDRTAAGLAINSSISKHRSEEHTSELQSLMPNS